MSKITVRTYHLNDPYITCVISMRPDGNITIDLHTLWVSRGRGAVSVQFDNTADFRQQNTIYMPQVISIINDALLIDCQMILRDDKFLERHSIKSILKYMNQNWIIKDQFIFINGHSFDLTYFRLDFDLTDPTFDKAVRTSKHYWE